MKTKIVAGFQICIIQFMHSVPKWSDTLLKYCNKYCKILKLSGHFRTLCIKGVKTRKMIMRNAIPIGT